MDKKNSPVHILVIRLSAMGDVAMMIPVLNTLIATYPNIKVTVLTKKSFSPMFASIPRVDVHIANVKSEHKGFPGLWRLYKELKSRDIDAVADLHNVLRSNVLKKYFGLTGISFKQIDKGRREKKALTRLKNKEFGPLKTTHERYTDVFSDLDFPIDLSEWKPLERQPLPEKIVNLIGQDTKKWIGIAPFAAHEGKMYPLTLMKEVINELDNTDKYKILLFGGGEDETRQLEEMSGKFSNALNLAGKLSLEEELAIISNLDVMVSMDSGNGHLAANYNIPVVTLWGVTHPYSGFYPFNQPLENALLSDREKYPGIPTSVYGNKVPEGYEKVMETISPQRVADKILEVLGN
ncbi:glycosyltransferase family 9 protein [Flagellimonas meridianipacifica]|uniref:ADP-heptose:LPS heptosyltransferase n=1 Tax=Flagellimonas meridianipacifica TaxID=1080225 RepID=A0A2T0MHA9_9FLAO|nr:glycosyltransferase family 9 protein [Allomuricauda pacifica]PRX56945.1 ADP-heptose:LPS heptosyltransferase [Allomuricauda pacifica]